MTKICQKHDFLLKSRPFFARLSLNFVFRPKVFVPYFGSFVSSPALVQCVGLPELIWDDDDCIDNGQTTFRNCMNYYDIKHNTKAGTGEFYLSQLSKLMGIISEYSNDGRIIKFRNSDGQDSELRLTTNNTYDFVRIIIDQTNKNDVSIPDAVDIMNGEKKIEAAYNNFWVRSSGSINERYLYVCQHTLSSYTDCSWGTFETQLGDLKNQVTSEIQSSNFRKNVRDELIKFNDEEFDKNVQTLKNMQNQCDDLRPQNTEGVTVLNEFLVSWDSETDNNCTNLISCGNPNTITNSNSVVDDKN